MKDRLRLIERRDVDELIILDIAATPNGRGPRFDEVAELCENLFCPVTVGGGVRNVEDIRRLLASGADKVAIKTAATPSFVAEAAQRFGNQAIVVSIDVERGMDAMESARHAEASGAGEILLTSIDRDGMMNGYDLDLIRSVSGAVAIPVIAAGGCGGYGDIAAALNAGAHACAVGAAFQFKEMTPKGASRYLHERGYSVRL